MITRDELIGLLARPSESVSLDFKAVLGWSSSKLAQIECLRDIACLANRRGGRIVVGVRQTGGSTFVAEGMRTGDEVPDPTKVGLLFRNHFDPVAPVETAEFEIDGKRFGVIEVPGVSGYPLICSQTFQDDPQKPPAIRRGAMYVRSDAANCEEAGPAQIREVIDQAVARTGAAIRRMLTTTDPVPSGGLVPSSAEDKEAAKKYATLRAADLVPATPVARLGLRRIEELLEGARVRGGGETYFPRGISRADDGRVTVLRLPDRLILRSEGKDFAGRESLSVARFGRDGHVAVRESLWEDTRGDRVGVNKIGTTSLFGFTIAALLFAQRFYATLNVDRFTIRIGIVGPLGRTLFTDSDHRVPFMSSYTATSDEDLWVQRELSSESVAKFEGRLPIAKEITNELFEYFGWQPEVAVYEALVNDLRRYVALGYDN